VIGWMRWTTSPASLSSTATSRPTSWSWICFSPPNPLGTYAVTPLMVATSRRSARSSPACERSRSTRGTSRTYTVASSTAPVVPPIAAYV